MAEQAAPSHGLAISSAVRPWLALLAATVFLSAFLLFQVQPIMGRLILPHFGGGAAVWTTTLLFFQVTLLVGYAYAHLLSVRLSIQRQAMLHAALVLLAALVLPIFPDDALVAYEGGMPSVRVFMVLAVTVGPPYLLLATTAPLLQRWFMHLSPRTSPYPLYALSNAGSLLALLSYPVVIEPLFGLRPQAWAWSAAYIAFAVACSAIAWRTSRSPASPEVVDGAGEVVRPLSKPTSDPPTVRRVVLWVALTATASAMLMATTNALTTDVASFPLLWVVPLAIYLLTFIVAFSSDRTFDPTLSLILFAGACVYGAYLAANPTLAIGWALPLHSVVLFTACLLLHGQAARLRPHAEHLTLFYFAVAGGGALGGFAVAVLAPLWLADYWEYQLALFAAAGLALIVCGAEVSAGARGSRGAYALLGVGGAGVVVLAVALFMPLLEARDGSIEKARNFYGVVEVYQAGGESEALDRLVMRHGRIIHGFQYLDPELSRAASGYYGERSGAGLVLTQHPSQLGGGRRVGVVGLGAGMLSTYARPGDEWTYLEIDPQVARMAEAHFTYLADSRARGAEVDVRIGDGRVLLDEALHRGDVEQFDVLLLDAFTSGAVPVHLLTVEAFEVYMRHLAPDGVLAVHVTNQHVSLARVVRGTAEALGLHAHLRSDDGGEALGGIPTDWVLVSTDGSFVLQPEVTALLTPWPEGEVPLRWTDDRASVWPVLTPF